MFNFAQHAVLTKEFRIIMRVCPIFIAACLFFCVSCTTKNGDLIYSVSDFNVPISCISPSNNDSTLWVGFENGKIILVNYLTDQRTFLKTNFFNSRIYDIVQKGDMLWLGVRNHGLVRYHISNDSIEKQYNIAVPDYYSGTTNYAPYDIEIDENRNLFIGTSSGVYCLDELKDTLTCMHRPYKKPYHFGVNQVKAFGDFVLCATDSGLVMLNKYEKGNQQGKHIANNKFSHLFLTKDSLYASSPDSLWKHKLVNDTWSKPSVIPKNNLFAYLADSIGIWEFYGSQITYSNNEGYIEFPLQEKMNNSYRNYLTIDTENHLLFFAQGTMLYSFSRSQNPKGKLNHIIAVHTVTNLAHSISYFISNNDHLYSVKPDDKKIGAASWLGSIRKLGDGENIIQMCHSKDEDCLWFITRDHLYKIDLKPTFRKKLLNEYKATIYSLDDRDFKSIYYDDMNNSLYVGSRFKLNKILLSKDTTVILDIIPEDDLYVTDIINYNNKIFLSSLNHGLIVEEKKEESAVETELRIIGSDTIIKEKKLIACPQGFLLIDTVKTMPDIKSASKLLYLNLRKHQVIIGYKGIGDIEGKWSHFDMHFNKAAIADGIRNNINTILLGTQTGLYEYDFDSGKIINSIEIPKEPYVSLVAVISIALLVLFIIITAYYIVIRKIRKNLEKRKNILSEAIVKNKKHISDYTIEEEQDSLLEGANKINLNEIKTDSITVFKLLKCVRDVNALENKLNDLEKNFQDKQINRHLIINENEKLLTELMKILEQFEQKNIEQNKADRIKTSYELLKKFITQIQIESRRLKEELINKENALSEKVKNETKLTDLTKSIREILEKNADEHVREELNKISAENCYSFDALKEHTKLLDYLVKNLAQYRPADELTDEMKKRLETIRHLTGNKEIKEESEKFVKDYFVRCLDWQPRRKILACFYLNNPNATPAVVLEQLSYFFSTKNNDSNDKNTIDYERSQIHKYAKKIDDNLYILLKNSTKGNRNRKKSETV